MVAAHQHRPGLGQHVNEVIESALAVLSEPVVLPDDVHPDFVEEAIEQVLSARIEAYIADRDDAVRRLKHVRLSALARAEQFRAEADRLQRAQRRYESIAAFCDVRALDLLVVERDISGAGGVGDRYKVEIDGSYAAIRVSRSASVAVDDLDELPRSLVRTKVEPDKAAIKRRLKAGEPVPGARLEERISESIEWGK